MIIHGDCIDVLKTLPESSVDACVTDPPYGIGFMGREWDTFKPGVEATRIVPNRAIESDNPNLKGRTRGPASSPSAVEYDYTVKGLREFQAWTEQWARQVFRVLKPGAHIVVCGAPRSYHRMACGLEDAGFQIRDSALYWGFGQGFPKSLNVSKDVRFCHCAEPEPQTARRWPVCDRCGKSVVAAGLGTALKPAYEPIVVARKPFRSTVAENVERYGTGALNIDACRIGFASDDDKESAKPASWPKANDSIGTFRTADRSHYDPDEKQSPLGRWPANVLLDEDAAAALDAQAGSVGGNDSRDLSQFGRRPSGFGDVGSDAGDSTPNARLYGDIGGASRFYYVAKPSREERDMGCHSLPARTAGDATDRVDGSDGLNSPRAGAGRTGGARNIHPTVKPVELMRWLVRLVTPPCGTVLDPFAGSGTTGMACAYELRPFIGIEREAEYIAIAERRIAACVPLFSAAGESIAAEAPSPTQADLLGGDAA